jgi:hypothetical protein
MAETPEIPEAKDPFEKRAAVTIAILAVVLAVVGNKGDNAKTDAIIKTNEATNKWAYYQAKGIKGSIASAEHELLVLLAPAQIADADTAKKITQLRSDVEARLKSAPEDYKAEQVVIKMEAEAAEKDAERGSRVNDRCDQGSLALQIAIVIASVSILARSRAFWIGSIILGVIGIAVGAMAFWI